MALDFSAGQLEFTVPNPTDTVTDFSFILLLTRASHGDFFDACTVENAAQMRLCKGDETTELAFDPIDEDWTTDAESILLRVKWSGSLTSTGSYTLIVLPALSTNTAYSASDTYGQYNAYDSSWDAYWADGSGLNDRTSNNRTGSQSGAPVTVDGLIGDATSYDGVDDYTSLGSTWLSGWAELTLMCLVNHGDVNDQQAFVSAWEGDNQILFESSGSGSIYVVEADARTRTDMPTGTFDSTNWQHTALTFDNSNIKAFESGAVSTSSTTGQGVITTSSIDLCIAANSLGGKLFNGELQHISIHTVSRGEDWVAYEDSQASDNSTFWGTPVWVSGDTSTNFTGGIDQDQTIAGAFKVKIPFTGGSEQAQTITGALSIISQSTDFTGGVSQGQTVAGELLLKTKFSGGISQGQTIAGQIEIIAAETNFTGGISQSQESGGEQKIVLSFTGGLEQGQTVSGTIKVIGADTNFSGGVSQDQEVSGQVAVTDNSIQFTGGITQEQDVAGEFTVVIPPSAFAGGSEQDQDVSGYFRSLIEITPDIITVNGEIQRALTITGTIQRTLAIKGELV